MKKKVLVTKKNKFICRICICLAEIKMRDVWKIKCTLDSGRDKLRNDSNKKWWYCQHLYRKYCVPDIVLEVLHIEAQ